MKKILVIGCPGSGKSTYARRLQKITDLPLYYLDMLFWNADKTVDSETDKDGNKNILFTTDVESTADVKETILIKNLGAGSFNASMEEKFLKKKQLNTLKK